SARPVRARARRAPVAQPTAVSDREADVPTSAPEGQLHLPVDVNRERVIGARGARRSLAAVGLFAGVGGIERGLAAAGHRALLLCEIEPTARAVLDHRFPDVAKHDDVTTLRDLP